MPQVGIDVMWKCLTPEGIGAVCGFELEVSVANLLLGSTPEGIGAVCGGEESSNAKVPGLC